MANLPVPIPASEVPGNFITGALWNANVYNGLTFTLNPPEFVGVQTAAQSVANSTWTALSLDSETVDTYGGHSTSSNTSRYVAQVAGYYRVCGVAVFVTNSTNSRAARIHVNGSVVQGTSSSILAASIASGVSTPVRTIFLNSGDYVEVAGWQNSGAAINTSINVDLTTALWVEWAHV